MPGYSVAIVYTPLVGEIHNTYAPIYFTEIHSIYFSASESSRILFKHRVYSIYQYIKSKSKSQGEIWLWAPIYNGQFTAIL